MRVAEVQDGEAFCILTNNPELSIPIKLDFRLVKADQVTTPDASMLDVNRTASSSTPSATRSSTTSSRSIRAKRPRHFSTTTTMCRPGP